eukprot:TRINITY_DN1119_c0_g1_i4.p1 TRINITY_DN1119_c0_g1~~TRINITY_DN1119_c0_g1_i4.p1  ORF type:complete len:1506 (-),score=632.79 TRINITY_DN1119_c0_g1_i4:111-4553(-)
MSAEAEQRLGVDLEDHKGDSEAKYQEPQDGLEDPSLRVKARLILEDGTEFHGYSFGAQQSVAGEVVFTTGMVGYPETLTDPSFRGQILVCTYPLIGNYGIPNDEKDEYGISKYFESDRIQVTGLVVSSYSFDYSHYSATKSLGQWLQEGGVPGIYGLDTRQLAKKIRVKGAMLGKIVFGDDEIPFADPNTRNLVAEVSVPAPVIYTTPHATIKIVAVHCGMKYNIIRSFLRLGVELKVVPWDYDFTNEEYDGLFLSNGPGDPTMCAVTIQHLRTALKMDRPIFGICLGNQLLALAAGARTYKMKFGNRGMNVPCIDLRTTSCYITAQNHGFAVDTDSLPSDWQPFFVNANDWTNEGIIHTYKPFCSVQFHPEACGGPTDTQFLFDNFLARLRSRRQVITTVKMPPPLAPVRRVLLLGSGGLSIGQAGEFDYSGSQAIKALREEQIFVVLVNPNIATVQTSKGMANKVYFLPITPHFVEQVIEKERPDAILLQFGGQTALNCGIKLKELGILERYGVRVLGTPISTIVATEDREVFAQKLDEINEHVAPSACAVSIPEALAVANRIGYPVLVRAAFALGGLGSGFASNDEQLTALCQKAFASSSQVIIDKSLRGWKEIEYEVVRDSHDNCLTVCNMENFDPLGIHTGDSIVVAPSQTLTNYQYFKLRETAIKVIRHLGVIGECNIQYALDPYSDKYCIIEVNARLSRSSALASKATGYPLAYVAAKLCLGYSLTDIKNAVTKITTACFEPSLDYVVCKIPRWDMRKFARVSSSIGSAMKSVGEVMGIGRTFEEAFQKAVRMVADKLDGFGDTNASGFEVTNEEVETELAHPSDRRLMAIALALQRGYSVERIHELTYIDKWFLCKLRDIIRLETALARYPSVANITREHMLIAKQYGFSDRQIARCLRASENDVRDHRLAQNIRPFVKQIDTLAAEFPAQTNYLYMTYHGNEHDVDFNDHGAMVLGCGAYRIGSSCEFDWCAVSCIRAMRSLGQKSITVNYNPETVSTDFDECDRLYFEELTLERVLDIHEAEASAGVVVSVGGQTPQNLAMPLERKGVHIFGTAASSIDKAEDRFKFSSLLDSIGVDQPPWAQLTSLDNIVGFAQQVGYPVLVRPSYVLSGAAMNVAYNEEDLLNYVNQATQISGDFPVVVSKFILNAKEIEVDAVALRGKLLNYAISEHVENAGVHSGDATLMLPAQKLYIETVKRVKRITIQIAELLQITGPFNIQFLATENEIKVIECNLRASRSFPFVSKTFNVNFIDLATKAMLGVPVRSSDINLFDIDFVNIKTSMFSFTRLQGADPVLRVEMASTGEVACFGVDVYEAFLGSLVSTGFKLPKNKTALVSIGPLAQKFEFLPAAQFLLQSGYTLYASEGTYQFLVENGITQVSLLYKPSAGQKPAIVDYLREGKIDLVINIPDQNDNKEVTDGYEMRRTAVDFGISLLTNIKSANLFAHAVAKVKKFHIKSWDEYMTDSKIMYQ